MSDDTNLRSEVEAAERLGISLKRFRGWEPTTTTTYYFDTDVSDYPIESTSTVEPEWDEVEQGWMLALIAWRSYQCPGCGGDLNITTKSENEERYRYELPLQCFRCVAHSQSLDAYKDTQYPLSLIHLVPPRPKRRKG